MTQQEFDELLKQPLIGVSGCQVARFGKPAVLRDLFEIGFINGVAEGQRPFIEQQGKGRRSKLAKHADAIMKWVSEGVSKRQIARTLGVSEGAIRHFLKNQQ